MNCNLTDTDRKGGMKCRSWDCQPCKDFGLSVNDITIINVHMENMALKEENAKLRVNLNTCKKDYWFMTNLLERYSTNKDEAIKDCIERMKFRNGLFNILNKEELNKQESEK